MKCEKKLFPVCVCGGGSVGGGGRGGGLREEQEKSIVSLSSLK